MSTLVQKHDLFEGEKFSPIQAAILNCDSRTIGACCGRRVGKTHVGARRIARWSLEDMFSEWEKLQRGERGRWSGEHLKASVANQVDPDIRYWVVAPRTEHLGRIRSNLLAIFASGPGQVYQHPKFPDWFSDRNRALWLWLDGICGRIDFIPATGQSALVSRGLHGCWIDEAGFVPNDRYLALRPALWEHQGRLLATGTPSLGDAHWFTRLAASGLDEGHERFDPAVSKRDERTTTFVADTVHHAFSEQARSEALHDARFWGSVWAAQWIYADWRQRGLQVFREWRPAKHHVELRRPFEEMGGMQSVGRRPWVTIDGMPVYEAPSMTYGVKDWSGGAAPGAAIVALVWSRNALDPNDPRPLVVIVDDHQSTDAYTDDGWWATMGDLERRHGVEEWIADPHAPRLIREAQRSGFRIRGGAHQDKLGRLSLIAALLHYDESEGILPALYVSTRCQHLPREIQGYRWHRTRDGRATSKPRDVDDHCIDCVAMLSSEVFGGGGDVAIGGRYFGA